MYNVKRLAYEINPPPEAAMLPGSTDDPSQLQSAPESSSADAVRVEEVVRRVLAELKH
jgi:hypothetical protein